MENNLGFSFKELLDYYYYNVKFGLSNYKINITYDNVEEKPYKVLLENAFNVIKDTDTGNNNGGAQLVFVVIDLDNGYLRYSHISLMDSNMDYSLFYKNCSAYINERYGIELDNIESSELVLNHNKEYDLVIGNKTSLVETLNIVVIPFE